MQRTSWLVIIAFFAACSSPPRVIESLIPTRHAQMKCRRLVSLPWPETSEVGEPALIGNALYLVEEGAYQKDEDDPRKDSGTTWRVWQVDLLIPQSEPRLVFSCPGYGGFPLNIAERDGRPIAIVTYPTMMQGRTGDLEALLLQSRAKGGVNYLRVIYPYFAYLESDWFGPFSHQDHSNVVVGAWDNGNPRELFAKSHVGTPDLSLVLSKGEAVVSFSDNSGRLRTARVNRDGASAVSTVEPSKVTDSRLVQYLDRSIPVYVRNYRELVVGNLPSEQWLSLNASKYHHMSACADARRLAILLLCVPDRNVLIEYDAQREWTEFTIQGDIPFSPKLACDAKDRYLIGRMKDKSVSVCRLEVKE